MKTSSIEDISAQLHNWLHQVDALTSYVSVRHTQRTRTDENKRSEDTAVDFEYKFKPVSPKSNPLSPQSASPIQGNFPRALLPNRDLV